jgi:hypothetical protein
MRIVSAALFGCVLGGLSFCFFRELQPYEPGGWRAAEDIFMGFDGALLAGVVFGALQATLFRKALKVENLVVVGVGWLVGLIAANLLPALALIPVNVPRQPFPFDPLVEMVAYNAVPFITSTLGALVAAVGVFAWLRRPYK